MGKLLPARTRKRLTTWLGRKSLGFASWVTRREYAALKFPGQPILRLDYPTSASNFPRWVNPHPQLEEIIARHKAAFRRALEVIADCREDLARIDVRQRDPREPCWINPFLPGLDSAAIYAFLRSRNPSQYLEVGSGNSTKFAHRARRDGNLRTRIVSIDPNPRDEIDEICDRVIRSPLEASDLSIFDELDETDVVFLDGSHRVFMNSDVTVFFLEALPRLAPGVLVGVHDIFLPYDYPAHLADRYYSEQYVLAAYLIAGVQALDPVLAAWYVSQTPELRSVVEAVWSDPQYTELKKYGSAFWIQIRGWSEFGLRFS